MSAINITDEDIQYPERILLSEGNTFGSINSERCNFIKNLNTLDLQAVPGSGKTTALLAKLLILEKHMPFNDGSGILVISHTNAAVDEIKDRIGTYCPHLFSYPNFVGTIQKFVDEFLTKPYFCQKNGKKLLYIEEEMYKRELEQNLNYCLSGHKRETSNKVKYIYNCNPKLIMNYRLAIVDDRAILVKDLNSTELKVAKPKPNLRNYVDYKEIEKQEIYKYLYNLKSEVMKSGILHYDDAYFLAERYLQKLPKIKEFIQKRFKYVFVDEMQDMEKHQYDILEHLFYDDGNSSSIYQRIGDKNQAIFSGDVKLEEIWNDRKVLPITGSHRLTKEIGSIVQPFALIDAFIIESKNVIEGTTPLLPHLLIFDNSSTECCVIQKYVDLVKKYQAEGKIPQDFKTLTRKPIAAIAWRKEHEDTRKICLKDYCPKFNMEIRKPIVEYDCLEKYFIFNDKKEKGLKAINQNLINAILKAIRLSGIKDSDDRYFNKKRLFDYLMDRDNEQDLKDHDELQRNLYEWSMSAIRGKSSSVLEEVQTYIKQLLKTLSPQCTIDEFFFKDRIERCQITEASHEEIFDCDRCSVNGKQIYINTVHSVKGKTHSATLYLESNYQEKNGIGYESQRLAAQFLGKQFNDGRKWHKQSTKMIYVGFSRPTHFLCVALSKKHFAGIKNEIDRNKWKVVFVNGWSGLHSV